MRRILFLLLKVSISLGLLFLALRSIGEYPVILSAFLQTNPAFVSLALLLTITGMFISALKWLLILQNLSQIEISYREILKYYWIAKFYSTVLPLSVGGEIMRHYYLRKHDIRTRVSIESILIDRITGVFFILVIAGGLLFGTAFSVLAVLVLGIGITALLLLPFAQYYLTTRSGDGGHPSAYRWILYYILAFVFQIIVVAFLLSLVAAHKIHPSREILGIMQLAELASTIPVTFQGLGLRELLYTSFITGDSHLAAKLVSTGLLVFLLNVLASLPGLFFFLVEKKARDYKPVSA